MPSASLQSRIQAFEALSSSSSPAAPASSPSLLESPISPAASSLCPIAPAYPPSPSPSAPSLARRTSLIDLQDWIVDDGPVERPSVSRRTLSAGISKLNGIRESSSTPPPRMPIPAPYGAPLINLESPPKPRPPLPPRKPSLRAPTQRSASAGSETGATLRPPGRPDSLAIEHTYPPGPHKFGAGRMGHAPASSISSFHSVSLSSDGSNVEIHSPKPPSFTFDVDSSITDVDTASVADSFENVSAPSTATTSTASPLVWEQATGKSETSPTLEPPGLPNLPGIKAPPALPPKPLARSISASSSSTATSTKTRRPPPPPPPYQPRYRPTSSRASVVSTSASTSDRSSILSNATTTSRTSISTRNSAQFGGGAKPLPLLRPIPVPPAARARYESLFISAVQGRSESEKRNHQRKLLTRPPLPAKKGRQAAGWRGLSVDLITSPEDCPVLPLEEGLGASDSEVEEESSPVGPEERLNGRIVKYIWSASRLDRQKLRSIWSDCDPQSTGFVDRDAFVGGMWRIDEELRRAQLARRTSALSAASSQRIPHRPLPPPRPQGTSRLLI